MTRQEMEQRMDWLQNEIRCVADFWMDVEDK